MLQLALKYHKDNKKKIYIKAVNHGEFMGHPEY